MPFLFSHICDLLHSLECNQKARTGLRSNAQIVQEWFTKYKTQLLREDNDITALLSTFFPEKRTDRVYNMQADSLHKLIGRALGLQRSRFEELKRYKNEKLRITLAECVESALLETPNAKCPPGTGVTVEYIDRILHTIASSCRFSSPAVRNTGSESPEYGRDEAIADLKYVYTRLEAKDAKWLTRMILKNYSPVVLDFNIVYRAFDPNLPAVIKVQDDFTAAGRIMKAIRCERKVTGTVDLRKYLHPTLGVKVGRQEWLKGRGISHCLKMGGKKGRMSVEEKMDGEYCQIHIDLSKGRKCIQIFSKSGKDSTEDRSALHNAIRKSLQLDDPSCPLQSGCILEGEVVVYCDKKKKVLEFDKIRKYVLRSGTRIGTEQDSPRRSCEHLMIVYYDLLMVDGESLLPLKLSERLKRLEKLVTEVEGRAALVERSFINLERPAEATSDLKHLFARCVADAKEGLVLKRDDPYFNFFNPMRVPYGSCVIKLKKGYITGFGDVGDFAVVGARFDATEALKWKASKIKWTHFYIACLENKEEVVRFGGKPRFVVTNTVGLNDTQREYFKRFVNPPYVENEEDAPFSINIQPGVDDGKRPSAFFQSPPVFDIRCFLFENAGNTGFFRPRFPGVGKIHCDRSYHDAVSFAELQDMAVKEQEKSPEPDSQEIRALIKKLENADPKSTIAIIDEFSQATTARTESQLLSPSTPSSTPNLRTRHLLQSPPDITPAREVHRPTVIQDRANGRLTPPRSSNVQTPQTGPPVTDTAHHSSPSIMGRKRILEFSEQVQSIHKVQKRGRDHNASGSVDLSSSSGKRLLENIVQREPLKEVSSSSLRRNRSSSSMYSSLRLADRRDSDMAQSFSESRPFGVESGQETRPHVSLAASMSFQGTFDNTPPQSTRLSSLGKGSSDDTTPTRPDEGSTTNTLLNKVSATSVPGQCTFCPDSCTLSGYYFLLSPCIANYPWVTEDLLSCHGCGVEFARSWEEWMSPNKTGKKRKRIILVDRRRDQPTRAFLDSLKPRIRQLTEGRKDDRRYYFDIYDWRALEKVREEEKRCSRKGEKPNDMFKMGNRQGVWKASWVGLAG